MRGCGGRGLIETPDGQEGEARVTDTRRNRERERFNPFTSSWLVHEPTARVSRKPHPQAGLSGLPGGDGVRVPVVCEVNLPSVSGSVGGIALTGANGALRSPIYPAIASHSPGIHNVL